MEGAEGPPPSPPRSPLRDVGAIGAAAGSAGGRWGFGVGVFGGSLPNETLGGGDVGVSAFWDCVGGLEGALLYGAGCGFWEDSSLWDHGRGLGGLCLMALCGGTLGVSAL